MLEDLGVRERWTPHVDHTPTTRDQIENEGNYDKVLY